MPKTTFTNLNEEKSAHVYQVLLDLFYDTHVSQVTVSEIVEGLAMSRGAFYKYFNDIYDAYYTTVKKCAVDVHMKIMQSIRETEDDFLLGLKQYLSWCAELDPTRDDWKSIQLLTLSNANIYAKRTAISEDFHDSKMVKNWLDLLDKNDFYFSSNEESLYFLYFIERLVITSLQDFVVNNWSKNELIKDFSYKEKWLLNGIKNN